jgi:hypothetical protein
MFRPRTIVLALALVASASACKKDAKPGTGAGIVAEAGGDGLKSTLRLFPKDADAVVGINFGKVRDSALYKKYEPAIVKAAGEDLAKLKEACGADPIAKLGNVVVAIKSDGKQMTSVIRGLDKATATKCAQKAAEMAKAKGEDASVVIDGNYLEMKKGAEPGVGVLFIDDTTMVSAMKDEKGLPKAELEAIAKGLPEAESLAGSSGFTDVVAKTDTSDALWFVLNGASPAMQQSPMKFQSAYGSLEITDGLAIDGNARFDSEATAKTNADTLKAQVEQAKANPMFGNFVSDVTIDQKGSDVSLKIKFSQQQLESIGSMIGPMLGQQLMK